MFPRENMWFFLNATKRPNKQSRAKLEEQWNARLFDKNSL